MAYYLIYTEGEPSEEMVRRALECAPLELVLIRKENIEENSSSD